MSDPLRLITLCLFLPGWILAAPALAQDTSPDLRDPLDALPGHWQFTHDDPLLGSLAAGGALVNLSPLLIPALSQGSTEFWVEKGGQHYIAWNDPNAVGADDLRGLRAGVGLAGIWGGFFSIYGQWDQYVKTDQAGRRAKYGTLTMADYLTAPFQPQFVFNFDVFPVFPLLELYPTTFDDWKKVGGFFQRNRVDFLGNKVSPGLGLGLTAAGAMTLVAANAALEEIAFRGILLDRMGVVGSSLVFGANHLINAFALPNFSFEEAGQQAAFATLFGLYTASRTEANGGDFRRMIALHYWHNVTTLVLGYLVDPDHAQLFEITVPL